MTHPFRAAVEARDIDAALALLAEDVVFRSPVVFAPYRGREAVAPILRAFSRVAEDFRYAFFEKPPKGIGLDFDEVREVFDLAKL